MSVDPQNLEKIRVARLQLITEGLLNSRLPDSLVSSDIERSWRRSVSHGVTPTTTPRILSDFELDSTLLTAANRVLDQWADSLHSSHMTLILADKQGRIIARRTTDARDRKNLDHVNAVEGSDFSEKSLGTNGLGTSLEGRGIVVVRGTEHFNDSLAQITCSGVPVTHPITDRIIGSLSIAGPLEAPEQLLKAITVQAGRRISEEIAQLADSRDLDLARAYRRLKSSRRPVLVLNSETVMTDLPALAHLDAEFHAILWEELRRHSWSKGTLHLPLPMLATTATVRRLTRDNREEIFALEFSPSPPISPSEADEIARPDSKSTHTFPSGPTSESPAVIRQRSYHSIPDELTAAASEPGPLRIVGAHGVGKRFQATRWLRERTGKEPVLFSIQDQKGDSLSWEGVMTALDEKRGVVIAALTGLSHETRAKIEALATSLKEETRIVLTELPSPGAPSPITPQTVVMSPLTELPSSIPNLAREVCAELFPDAPEPKFSHAALQRLLAWPWPLNVAELRQLLASLPQILEGQTIQVRHLPPALRQNFQPSAGGYEQAEREAIISALEEAGGNKSETAEILGIGRTTLYRKIRTLGITLD